MNPTAKSEAIQGLLQGDPRLTNLLLLLLLLCQGSSLL